jgi:hypothetical protein
MNQYGILLRQDAAELALAEFTDQQTDSYKAWITTVTDLVNGKAVGEVGVLMRQVRVGTFAKKPFLIRFYGDQAALWEPDTKLNRQATVLLGALNKQQFFVGTVLVLPDLGENHKEDKFTGWTKDEANEVLKVLDKEIYYQLKYNIKRRHEHGGSPTHPQFYHREG